jgi:Protein of unknown function (DUF4089)
MKPQPMDGSAYWANYVDNMAALNGFRLDAGRRAEIILQLQRIEVMARQLEDFPLAAEVEPAAVFRP